MRSRSSTATSAIAGLFLLLLRDVQAQTSAPPSEGRCLEAYEKGQRLRLKHSLREARAELLLCARAPCPDSFRPECLQWFDEVQRMIPTVIIRVEGDTTATEVRVLVDGVVAAARLDGTAIEVDPGEHLFRFEPKDRATIEQKVVVNEGEKARVLSIAIEAPGPPAKLAGDSAPLLASSSSRSIVPWIFGGVGVIALGSFAYFGATGLSRRHQLDECNPYCAQSDIDFTRRRFVVADISLAVSVLSFGIATYSWLSATPSAPTSGTSPLRLQASAGPSSAFAGLAGAF